ncbi:hypothetical protein B0H14DRAFT_3861890 [Mycena olivaceomarginata]|nr:hypothetical protein B0H14DRAFT_3861890 [Mycena olivaceomarginata]
MSVEPYQSDSSPLSPPLPLELPLEIQFLILNEMKSYNNSELQRLAFVCLAWANHIQSLLFQQVDLVDASNVCTSRFLSKAYSTPRTFNPSFQTFTPSPPAGRPSAPLNESAHAWSTVRELCIRFYRPSPVVDLWGIITRFPALECLCLLGLLPPIPGTPAAEINVDAPVVHLKHLALVSNSRFSAQPAVLRLCVHDIIVDNLSVTLTSPRDCDASLYNLLLRKVGPTLRDLEVVELPEHETPVIRISLAACTSLRCLTLRLRFSTTSPQAMRLALIPMLHQVTPTLGTLTLEMSLSPTLFDLPWEEVDQILARGLPSGVERVVFAFMPAKERIGFELMPADGSGPGLLFGDFSAAMKEQMVGLERRRLLYFERSVL